jgi:hypothetical protein
MRQLMMLGLALLTSLGTTYAKKKELQWPVSEIPDSIKKDVHSVIRNKTVSVKVVSPAELQYTETLVVTVLDKEGVSASAVTFRDGKQTALLDYQGVLYDSIGKELRKTSKDSWYLEPASPESYAYSETMERSHRFSHEQYPYTVVYTATTKTASALYLPPLYTIVYPEMSMQTATYTLDCPEGWPFTFNAKGVSGPETKTEAGRTISTWTAPATGGMHTQPGAEQMMYRAPNIWVSPGRFELGGVPGSMASWADYSNFYARLNQGRDVLPAPQAAEVKQLTAGIKDTFEIISKLYKHLQQNNRYVNVALGIGGLQTHDAAYVANKNFGDCKALSNYMKAMLNVVGIPSNYVLVYAGEEQNRKVVPAFPSHRFNHVILGIPLKKDTVYLECTAPVGPAGYMGLFTQNRYGLWISEQGGALCRIPAHQPTDNTSSSYALLDLSNGVPEEITCRSRLKGYPADSWMSADMRDNQTRLVNLWNTMHESLKGNSLVFTKLPGRQPLVEVETKANPSTLVQVTPKRMMVDAAGLSATAGSVEAPEEGQPLLPVNLTRSFQFVDTLEVIIPGGYEPEYTPGTIKYNAPVGDYQLEFVKKENHVLMIRRYTRYQGQFAAPVFTEWRSFLKNVANADASRLILVRKSGT